MGYNFLHAHKHSAKHCFVLMFIMFHVDISVMKQKYQLKRIHEMTCKLANKNYLKLVSSKNLILNLRQYAICRLNIKPCNVECVLEVIVNV